MKSTSFTSQILYAESDFKHPLLAVVKFIFADDKPNGNNQGIRHEDFPEIIRSAIDTPIKMRYLGEAGAGGHTGAITIGHIRSMSEREAEDGSHQLIAEGVLYAQENSQEVEWLRKAFANKDDPNSPPPGASWEIRYQDEEKEGPISWLKGVVTRAATFVRNPAYGTRTALLALASDENVSDEDFNKELLAIANETSPKNTNKGGSNKVEEELKKELEAQKAEVARLTSANAELTTKVEDLTKQNEEKDKQIAESNKAKLIAERVAKVEEAGLKLDTDPEKLARKQEFLASLDETAFAEYLTDLKAMAPKAPLKKDKDAAAELNGGLPRFDPNNDDKPITIESLKAKFRENRVRQ